MALGNNIRYLVGTDDPIECAAHFKGEAKRLKSLATRLGKQGYTTTVTEILERVDICLGYVRDYEQMQRQPDEFNPQAVRGEHYA